jgi:S-adenosylmethionine:diacylglycerol 3-amino-3-carboxypropyl transferase
MWERVRALDDEAEHWRNRSLEERRRAETAERERTALLAALRSIAAIKNQMHGPDWEEIDEARAIANTAITNATKSVT